MEPQDEPTNDNPVPTPDDDLEETRNDPLNAQVGDEPLPEDHDPPAAAPTALPNDPTTTTPTTDDTHPSNDSNTDETETYDQGL